MLPLTPSAEAAAALPWSSEGRRSCRAHRRRGPLSAAGTWEELLVPGSAWAPDRGEKPEFLIACWHICVVTHPDQDVGGII